MGDKMGGRELLAAEMISAKIIEVRGEKVILDRDIAELYGVETKQLKRAVRRNRKRFPEDFLFELTSEENSALRCHFGTLKPGEHSKYLPYVFTEQGVAMLSSVLHSERAIQVNIHIMRAFVRYRQFGPVSDMRKLANRIDAIENKLTVHDDNMRAIFTVIRKHFLGHPKE